MADANGERELLNAEQVAAMLGMTSAWVYEQSRKGRIPTITLGRYRRYRRAAIEGWLLSMEQGNGGLARATPLQSHPSIRRTRARAERNGAKQTRWRSALCARGATGPVASFNPCPSRAER